MSGLCSWEMSTDHACDKERESFKLFLSSDSGHLLPGTKPIYVGNIEELLVARGHAGPVFALVRRQENMLEESCLKQVLPPLLPPSAWI